MLAERGARVVLAVRNLDRGKAAADQMEGDVELGLLDVADLSSVRAFADQVGPVDVLVNNAGALALPLSTSPDGVELHLATNHLGHFALTNLLLPRLTDRVVVVGSPSHRHGHLDLDDLAWSKRNYRPYSAYADSKLANLLFMAELQRRLTAAGSTLRVTGAHPGSTATGITGSTGGRLKKFVGKHGHRLVGMPGWQGALTTLYAATTVLASMVSPPATITSAMARASATRASGAEAVVSTSVGASPPQSSSSEMSRLRDTTAMEGTSVRPWRCRRSVSTSCGLTGA